MNKNQLRDHAKQIRANIPEVIREQASEALSQNIIAAKGAIHDARTVGTYYPIGTEIIPPHELSNKQMALPVVRDGKTLEFYPWSPTMRLVKRDFNIPIPDTRGLSPIVPDVILLPLLLCDKNGNRIGYGAGHYDRYIDALDHKPILIGVCFDEQIYEGSIPAEPHDKKLNFIISPQKTIKI